MKAVGRIALVLASAALIGTPTMAAAQTAAVQPAAQLSLKNANVRASAKAKDANQLAASPLLLLAIGAAAVGSFFVIRSVVRNDHSG